MSMQVLGSILQEMRLDLSETEKQELDEEMQNEFGILDLDHCDKLENEWELNRSKVQEIVYTYINKKRKKKPMLVEISA